LKETNSAEFVTVVMPLDLSRQAPELKVFHSQIDDLPNLAVEISGAGQNGLSTDYVAWSPSITDHAASSFQLPRFCCLVAFQRHKRRCTLCRLQRQ